MKKKIFCFDIDNTICKTSGTSYKKAKPIKKSINIINQLYKKGFVIKIFTARFMGRSNENAKLAASKGYKFTKQQLEKWNVKYNYLIFGKPTFDILVDDRSFNFDKKWNNIFKKKYL